VVQLLITLIASGMFAAAFAVGRVALLRLVRRQSERPRVVSPPPPDWLPYLDHHVPLVQRLSANQRQRLLVKTRQLLEGCRWEGCAGLRLTDAMRLTIAAQASLLVLEHEGEPYPEVDTILVYPGTFRPRRFSWTPSAEAEWEEPPALGESWKHGVVILAWDSVAAGGTDPADGHNVVFHEFAHQLDTASGPADGVPRLPAGAYEPWSAMLEHDFDRLVAEAGLGRQGVLDHYGATSRAEFFAVATEAFFERPAELRHEHPELYAALRDYYKQDPAGTR
jgi:Mlc titration factor MtfA (ptsG expression regulator)